MFESGISVTVRRRTRIETGLRIPDLQKVTDVL